MKKYTFPEGFYWGSATASYQIEGAVNEDGRGETIWDRYCQMPGHIMNGDKGDIAADHYHRFREDVALMKKLGHNCYRFSIAWSRILPQGTGEVNEKGLQFYSDLIDELLANDIEPFVTLFHWDLPQALQDRGGWQNPESITWFTDFCRIIYEKYGDRVHNWITLNEPICTSFYGFYEGTLAPGYHDLGTAILVSYNLLRAHGAAVRLFHEMKLEGEIGITLNMTVMKPYSQDPKDLLAYQMKDGYYNRWFLDPVLKGQFPRDIIEVYQKLGISLPDFSKEAECCEPIDFLGINYYYTRVMRYDPLGWPFCAKEVVVDVPRTGRNSAIDPQGFTDILVRLKNEYNVQKFYITENGATYPDVMETDGKVRDMERIDYIARHLIAMHNAMEQGCDIRGYFVWSLYDNFEWAWGRYMRFGLVWLDFDTMERIPKESAWWFKKVIEDNAVEG